MVFEVFVHCYFGRAELREHTPLHTDKLAEDTSTQNVSLSHTVIEHPNNSAQSF